MESRNLARIRHRHDADFDWDKMMAHFGPAAEAYRAAADVGALRRRTIPEEPRVDDLEAPSAREDRAAARLRVRARREPVDDVVLPVALRLGGSTGPAPARA